LYVTPDYIDLPEVLGVPLDQKLLTDVVSIQVLHGEKRDKKLVAGRDFVLKRTGRLSVTSRVGPVTVSIAVTCTNLAFAAILDFERLLALADAADLEKIDDFASIDVRIVTDSERFQGTRITADKLKPFVRR